ncbi:hypothetical protein [Roseobacter litoralis]|uniref:Uncharacterized protein n=1 Tax=Roseobacter litoralis (strain ATCC 49566 / DSM 6996 / JCM 21268 / NBRC 15278 / OCh 149) TaxID=391595 RepID=F7ZB11_ROSLO|nr:hypothetical protein [Roseobacter litoralis]AEI95553.1 hypothetical protein RLO149_c036160 [Roseobacter litoralis Och 149]
MAIDASFANPNISLASNILQQKGKHEYSGTRLKSFNGQTTSSEIDFADYSRMAGLILVNESSLQSIFVFWEKTPELGWKRAFEHAFGMDVHSVYRYFEETL